MPADSNNSSLAAVRETSWGVLPALSGTPLKKMRITGEGLMHNKDTIVSDEIRDDRQISDLVEVGASAGGNVDFELSYLAWQEWLEAALFGTIVTIAATVTSTLSATGQTLTAATGTPFANVQAGCYVKLAGHATAGNNGPKMVIARTDTVLTFVAGSIVANETSVAGVVVSAKQLVNGKVRRSYTVERNLLTSANLNQFQQYVGMEVDKLGLTFESKKIVTGKMEFVGKLGSVSDVSLMDVTGAKATGTLTLVANPANNETVTIGAKTFTFKTALTGGGATPYEVLIGATTADTLTNLIAANMLLAGAGTLYGSGNTAHTQLAVAQGAGTTATITALLTGVAGNAIPTTETMANAGNVFGGVTLSGGVNATPYAAANTDPVVNATSNVGGFTKDGVAMQERFKKLEINVANNLRGLDAISEKGNFDVGSGEFALTGSLTAYFLDNTMVRDFISHTYTGLAYIVTNSAGQRLGISLPKINFSSGGPPIGGKNTDVMQDQKFSAILSAYGFTLGITFLD